MQFLYRRPWSRCAGSVLAAIAISASASVVALGQSAPAQDGFYTITPCRLADTRNPNGTYGGPALLANSDRAFPMWGRCGIPSNAEAVAINVTVTGASAPGNLRLYPTGYGLPSTSAINYKASITRANNGSYAVSTSGSLSVRCDQAAGSTHLIMDVFGYFQSNVPSPPPPTPTPPPPPTGGGPYAWSMDWGGPTMGADSAQPAGIAVDGAGASIVVGYLKGRADFGGGQLTSAGSGDVYLVKYDSNGRYVWSQRFGSTADDRPKGVAVDAGGNVYITGYFRGTVSFGGAAITAAANASSGFLAKYTSAGGHIWSRRLSSGSSPDAGNAVATDSGGNVVVTGAIYGSADYGGGVLTSAGAEDVVLVKYSSTGSHVWSRRIGGPNSDMVTRVAVDQTTGEVVITGLFTGPTDFGGGTVSTAGGNDAFLAKYSSSGAHVWSRRWGAGFEDRGADVAIDALGNVAVTGQFTSNVDFGGGPIANAGDGQSSDIFLVKLSSTGVHLWSKGFGSNISLGEVGAGVDFDPAGSIVITGSIAGTINFGGGGLAGDGYYNVFVAKFASSGAHVWSKRFLGGGAHANGRAVACDSNSNVLAAGDFDGSMNFGGGTLTSPGASDTYLLKLGS